MQFTVKFFTEGNSLEIEVDGETTGPLTLGETLEQIAEYYYNQQFRYCLRKVPQDEPR